jgi:hypothetical protein
MARGRVARVCLARTEACMRVATTAPRRRSTEPLNLGDSLRRPCWAIYTAVTREGDFLLVIR